MSRDAVLPDEIRPLPQPAGQPHAVLITGATGFLGRHLVIQLLRQTNLRLVCMVRAATVRDARERLLEALAAVEAGMARIPVRVSVVVGDVEQGRFGMSTEGYRELANGVSDIIHCAAVVNWQRDYLQLRQVNVQGCLEIIRLACSGPVKRTQFVSSMAVCYIGSRSGNVDELSETLPQVGGMPLGYAQSKCVAESLFRQAARRGVPVRIIRPGLISGNSVTGTSEHDGLLSAMLEGCISSGAAPDIDWLVDCVPVDAVASVLAKLAGAHEQSWDVLHVVHDRGRHWREIVLWMNLYGYKVCLMPLPDWSRIVFRHGAPSARLRRFRQFFSSPRRDASKSAPYEAYLAPEQRRIDSVRSHRELSRLGMRPPPLDSGLLARYIDHYVAEGLVRKVGRRFRRASHAAQACELLERAMQPWLSERGLGMVAIAERPLHDSDGIMNELSAVRGGGRVGIKLYDVTVRGGNGSTPEQLPVVLKSKVRDELVEDLAADVATLCDPELGRLFRQFQSHLGFRGCHDLEIALYRLDEARLRRHTPACFGFVADNRRGSWALALEFIKHPEMADRERRLVDWDRAEIAAAIAGLGEIHSIWFGREAELERQPWLINVIDGRRQAAMGPLWHALAGFAAPRFSEWLGRSTLHEQVALVRTVGDRARRIELLPRTLIHNDFNPRNVVLRESAGRSRLCVFDWELATLGIPQHDLAEFLCFVLPQEAGDGDIADWLELHRTNLAASSGVQALKDDWLAGFQLALHQLLIGRLSMYAMLDRFKPLHFLPRVTRNWDRLNCVAAMLVARESARRQRPASPAKSPARIPSNAKLAATANRNSGATRRAPHA